MRWQRKKNRIEEKENLNYPIFIEESYMLLIN